MLGDRVGQVAEGGGRDERGGENEGSAAVVDMCEYGSGDRCGLVHEEGNGVLGGKGVVAGEREGGRDGEEFGGCCGVHCCFDGVLLSLSVGLRGLDSFLEWYERYNKSFF